MTNPTLEQRAIEREIARMREVAADWRRPELRQIEGPNDLKIYGGTIAFDIEHWAGLLESSLTFSHTGVEQAIEACAKVADEVERLQDNDHGAANTGGAAQAAAAIRATLPAQSPDDIAYAGAVQGERYCNHAATYRRPDTGETGPIYCVNCAPKNLKAASPVNVEGLVEALRPFADLGRLLFGKFEEVLFKDEQEIRELPWSENGTAYTITYGDLRRARQVLASLSPDGER